MSLSLSVYFRLISWDACVCHDVERTYTYSVASDYNLFLLLCLCFSFFFLPFVSPLFLLLVREEKIDSCHIDEQTQHARVFCCVNTIVKMNAAGRGSRSGGNNRLARKMWHPLGNQVEKNEKSRRMCGPQCPRPLPVSCRHLSDKHLVLVCLTGVLLSFLST